MAYTGHHTQTTGLAISDDLFTWNKQSPQPTTEIDTRFYESVGSGARPQAHWRDPFLFEQEGWVYQVVCASRRDGPEHARAALGLSRSRDMVNWEVLPPPETDRFCQEFECPQLYQKNGLWYAVFSCGPNWFSPSFIKDWNSDFGWFASYSMVAPSPFGPFRLFGNGRILPDTGSRQPYAGQLVNFQGSTYLLGTTLEGICDPIPVGFTTKGVKAEWP
jgi:beta-fructofuranosidase